MNEELYPTVVPVHRQAIYNPGRLTDPEVKASYIARQALLEMLLEDIRETRPGGIPQHHLIIGQRGMGKTTLLRRIDVALREDSDTDRFIPLSFPEEQWTLDRLSKLWLNCLDSLADTLEREVDGDGAVKMIDEAVEQLLRENQKESLLSEAAEKSFLQIVEKLGRRPVLLVDNLDLVFGRLSTHEQNRLRAFLMRAGAPILIGACVSPPSETSDYTAAFYDHFKTHYLDRLSAEEMRDVLLRLAAESGNKRLEAHLASELPRLIALHALTGGNPRTTVILFQIFTKGFSQEAYQDLEALLDWITPFYKARLEELSPQAQVVVSALATHWEPATAGQIGAVTRLENKQISPQLDRLKKAGIIEEVLVDPEDEVGPLPDRRSARTRTGYQLAERFFNIWFLMRQATRRDRRNLTFLTRFIECAHTPAERSAMARDLLLRRGLSRAERIYGLALEPAVADFALRYKLHDHVQQEIVEASLALKEKIDELIDPSEIPPHRFAFAELKTRLKTVVGMSPGISADEFADAILGAPAFLESRDAIANQQIDAVKAHKLIETARNGLHLLERAGGKDAAEWFSDLLRGGTVVDLGDSAQISEAFHRANTRKKVQLCVRYAKPEAKCAVDSKAWDTIERLFAPKATSRDADEWFEWGTYLQYDFERYEAAKSAYRRAIDLNSKLSTAWDNLGDLLADEPQRLPEAEAAYRNAINLDPNFASPWIGLGQLLCDDLDRNEEAETAYRTAIAIDPKEPLTWVCIGDVIARQGNRESEAEAAFREAIKVNPKYDYAWMSLGKFLSHQPDRAADAESALRKAVELDPRDSWAWNALGIFLFDNVEKLSEGEAAFRKAIELEPTEASHWVHLGRLMADTPNRSVEAEAALRKATELDPQGGYAWFRLGILLQFNLARYGEAEKAYRKAADLDPSVAAGWRYLGDLLHYRLGRFSEAEEAYRKAIEISADDRWSWNSLGLLLADCLGRYEEASEALQTAIELDPEDSLAPAYNLVSLLRDQLGRIKEAQRIASKLVPPEDETLQAGLLLHPALFAAYEENWGVVTEHLGKALDLIAGQSAFPPSTFPGWMRATAVFLHLGYGDKLLEFLRVRGDDQRLRPWYEAIRAHFRGDRRYLRNIPAEMRDVAGMLYDEINTRLRTLPDSTRRWSPPTGIKRVASRRRSK